ncbi:hypothetical protein D3C76_1501850 [compost metagenome]
MDLLHFQGTVDRCHVEHGHLALAGMIAGVHQHLRSARRQHCKAHGLEVPHLVHRAGQFCMRVPCSHLRQHGAGDAQATVAAVHGKVGHAACLGIALYRQVEEKAGDGLWVPRVARHNQFD